MALYPTPAGQRIPYDRDGSAGFAFNSTGGAITSATTAQLQAMNDELSAATNANGWLVPPANPYVGVVFAELWDITGFYADLFADASAPNYQASTSTNTTNGQDGTWTNIGGSIAVDTNGTIPHYRSQIAVFSAAGVKGFRILNTDRFTNDVSVHTLHIYGTPTAGTNPDSLRIWQPVTGAEVTTVFDFGDIARGSAATQQFRVHNQSATKTASTITVSMEALTDASPSVIGQYQLSTDNVTFANSITIPNLGPGATSAVLYVRDTVAAGAATGLWAARIVAAAGTFA